MGQIYVRFYFRYFRIRCQCCPQMIGWRLKRGLKRGSCSLTARVCWVFSMLLPSVCVVLWRDVAGRQRTGDDSWHLLVERLNIGWWPGSRSARSAARTSPSLKNKDLFLALDMPAAQNNKALNERSGTTLQSQASAYFCPQTSSVSLVLFIPIQTENLEQQACLAHNKSLQHATGLKHTLQHVGYKLGSWVPPLVEAVVYLLQHVSVNR